MHTCTKGEVLGTQRSPGSLGKDTHALGTPQQASLITQGEGLLGT